MNESFEGVSAAGEFRRLAELNYEINNFKDAFFHYVNCLKLCPEWKPELEERFLLLLCCLGQHFERQHQYDEIFSLYEEAIELYYENEVIQHNLGAHLLSLGYPDKAVYFFKESLKRNRKYFPATRSLHSSFCVLIERWHYRMLNDESRNTAYRETIRKKIQQGFDVVLDLGTGSGLFSLFAAEAGAKEVFACDYNPTMISIAKRVFQENFHISKNRIKLITKHSSDIEMPNDIPTRISLLVTETMDACMLGEHMLQSLLYAWENLLLPPLQESKLNSSDHGVVIPHSGSIWFCPVTSDLLARRFMFPVSQSSVGVDECAQWLANFCLISKNATVKDISLNNIRLFATLDEPYDTERLQNLPDCKFMAEPQLLTRINFNNPEEIHKTLIGLWSMHSAACTQNGYIHAIAAWFTVHLDEDDEISLCTAPYDVNAGQSCWDQAIFPLLQPYKVESGSLVNIEGQMSCGTIHFTVRNVLHPDGDHLLTTSEVKETSLPVSQNVISFLNDTSLITYLKSAALSFIEKSRVKSTLKVIDLYPVPIFGLSVILNALANHLEDVQMVYTYATKEDQNVILKIAENNNVPVRCLCPVWVGDFNTNLHSLPIGTYDAIILNVIDSNGDLNEEIINKIHFFAPLLKSDGYLLPKNIQVCGQLVQSDYIEESMRVVDRNRDMHRYKISHLINQYQVWQIVELNVASLPHESYSEPFVCHEFTMNDLNQTFDKSVQALATRNGFCNSVLYWHHIQFFDSQSGYSTLNGFAYVSQAAYLFKSPVSVRQNESIHLDFMYYRGALLIYKDFMQHVD